MFQKQADQNTLTTYMPILAALAAGTYGYMSGDDEEDAADRLMRALGYGALAGIGTSIVSNQLTPSDPKVLGVPTNVEDESTAKLLGAIAGGVAGTALTQALMNPGYWAARRDPKKYEKLVADLHRAQSIERMRSTQAAALGRIYAANQQPLHEQAYLAAQREAAKAARRVAQLRHRVDAAQWRSGTMSNVLGAVLGSLVGLNFSG